MGRGQQISFGGGSLHLDFYVNHMQRNVEFQNTIVIFVSKLRGTVSKNNHLVVDPWIWNST